LQAQPPGQRRSGAEGPRRNGDETRTEEPRHGGRVENRLGRDVEGAADVGVKRQAIRLGDIGRVHGLDAEARNVRHEAQQAAAQERRGKERAGEQPPDAGGGLALEDQPRPQPHDAHLGMPALESIQKPFHLGLVAGVEARADSGRGPALVHTLVLGPRCVRADGGGVHKDRDARLRHRLEDAPRALDVHPPGLRAAAGRLDLPRQMHDRLGSAEARNELARDDVRRGPLDLRPRGLGQAAGETENRRDRIVAPESLHEARADVPRRTYDDHSHAEEPCLPRTAGNTPVSALARGRRGVDPSLKFHEGVPIGVAARWGPFPPRHSFSCETPRLRPHDGSRRPAPT
jgi:hypothetical protein